MERGPGDPELTGDRRLRSAGLYQLEQGSPEALAGSGLIALKAGRGLTDGAGLARGQIARRSSHARDDTSGSSLTQLRESVRVAPDGRRG